ncbi:DUF58 domain-containing protein [Pseudoduganella aquatica]|uniref:DUF58 domain-containing protein n=1 Tax=Pseudoduganella aquatica TaxID=2660641 RepID=A0A7X4KQH0_9BURK|nr:DUF58 domain-containing protein [Pseudoduganella aquatica]MYN10915.1 DUF58 domain-containing protein [Pseudoduganella aquatica]
MTPARRLLQLLLAWAALGAAASVPALAGTAWPLSALWWLAGAALLAAALVDAWHTLRPPPLRLERQLPGVLPVELWHAVTLTVHNLGTRPLRLDLFDGYPAAWALEGMPHACTVAGGGFASVVYRVKPDQRGNARFSQPHVRVSSPWGLWQRTRRIGPEQTVKVFPDYSRLLGQTLQATERRAPAAGAIRKRRRGEGTDFRQLREYRQGDSLRSIDWKATARQRKPIAREYQEERDQQVVFLLDCGRRMLARDHDGADRSSHFDHALQAVLTLGFVAQKQGDSVGLMTFGGASAGAGGRWLAPAKGRAGFDRLLAGVYDVQPDETAPDYTQAAGALMNKLSKRAFVVLITNLRDEDDQAMRSACELLGTRHMVLCASLREQALDRAVAAPVAGFQDALRQPAAMLYLQQRREAIRRLGLRANALVDVAPGQLSAALIGRYLEIKESGQL